MEDALLATKLRIPPQPHRAVQRTKLIDALERGILHYKLSLISAPAGYGKTILLAQWAHSTHLPIVWLSVGEEDNDIERFLRYLLTAWAEAQPNIRETPLGLLLGRALPDSKVVLSAFINIANDVPDPIVFILDDYHLIEAPSIHQALTFLLDHLPPTLHFVLAGRTEPPLPLAKYRARSELLEFRTDDLQFLPEETATFLSEVMDLNLPQDQVAALQAQLEGWIVGLQLAALTLRRHTAAELIITGKNRFIADYLSEDVLAHLSDGRRQFLLQTSILDSLCGSLCDAVTSREGSQEMLETLERENLFLVPLDDNRQWFRYHRLFADFLYEQLHHRHADEVAVLHRRAARWHFDHDMAESAFQHALAGQDVELVTDIFERYVNIKLDNGEIQLVERWVNALPAEWYAAYPVLGHAKVGFLAFTGALEAGLRCLDEVEQRLTATDSEMLRRQLARVTAQRCMLACIQNDLTRVEAYADLALRELPEDDLLWRPSVYRALGDSYRQNGHWEAAKMWYLKSLSVPDSPVVRCISAHGFGALADLSLRQGRLRDAAVYWKKALAAIQDRENWGRFPLPVIGWVYIRLGEILYEWDQVAEAWNHVARGLEQAELGGDVRARIAGYLIAGRVKLTEGDTEAAATYLERARPLVENALFPEWISRFERFQLELWLAESKLKNAVNWVDEMSQSVEERPEKEVAQLAAAHVWITKGNDQALERALALLEPLHRMAEVEGRTGIRIEALALYSLAYWKCKEHEMALKTLECALRLAEPEGYMRLFADLGLLMTRLLQQAHSRMVLPDYVEKLLAIFGTDLASLTARDEVLLEPLTRREQEILQLIAAGLTNQEIADQLVVSPETIKKHSGSIYAKLGVRNRTEAVVRAREMGLLP
jgi:LuxR family maltose regulon positive regulatory protein